jgi:nucleotide sugar dehydrogenase
MSKVGFIGLGFVGSAVKHTFEKVFATEVYDIVAEKATVSSPQELLHKTSIIFVALPTPINKDGTLNLTNIDSTLNKLNNHDNDNVIVIKSSLPPGTTQKLQDKYTNLKLVFNPEFLTERNAIEDFKSQNKVILGGKSEHTNIAKQYYAQALPYAEVYQTDMTSAEMVKFIINCFLAAKISFFNEMYQVCQKLSLDYSEVLNLTLLDKRIGESHTKVPGWDGHLGFGGSCFPANINILINEMRNLNLDASVLEAVWAKNLQVRPEKDWELLKGRCVVKE